MSVRAFHEDFLQEGSLSLPLFLSLSLSLHTHTHQNNDVHRIDRTLYPQLLLHALIV